MLRNNSQSINKDFIIEKLKTYSKEEKKLFYYKFFKVYQGGYGYGDYFLGVTVPYIRKVAKEILNKVDVFFIEEELLKDRFHEVRMLALILLVMKYNKIEKEKNDFLKKNNISEITKKLEIYQKEIFNVYFRNLNFINNWDLVDLSAPNIVGNFLYNYYFINKNLEYENILFNLAKSSNLWENRIAIVSTLYFIKKREINLPIKICSILLNHDHDLIHKACGWILREIGKIDKVRLLEFIKNNYNYIHRTCLRYSIEKFEKSERERILKEKIN
ncbi:MAG: DNA alkylation repair protein [Spirochaetes bacterium]|nr:DNA alkylation repair protein [Spirochaetota bacterium]